MIHQKYLSPCDTIRMLVQETDVGRDPFTISCDLTSVPKCVMGLACASARYNERARYSYSERAASQHDILAHECKYDISGATKCDPLPIMGVDVECKMLLAPPPKPGKRSCSSIARQSASHFFVFKRLMFVLG